MGRIRARVKPWSLHTQPPAPPQPPEGEGLTPIARWDFVPYQRITAATNVGVVAFSKAGIWGVRFTIGSLAYEDCNAMALNEDAGGNGWDGVWEYWVEVDPADHDEGPITLNATVYGEDGGRRDLESITVIIDNGTLPHPEVWVDPVNGNNSYTYLQAVDHSDKPLTTISMAAKRIVQWNAANGRGSVVDGGVIRLVAGNHVWDSGGNWDVMPATNEWLTVTCAAGGSPADTKITRANDSVRVGLVRIFDVGVETILLGSANGTVWFDNCVCNGWDLTTASVYGTGVKHVYITNATISNYKNSTGRYMTELCRNAIITNAGLTVWCDTNCVINCNVDEVSPVGTGAHANLVAWQESHWDQRIMYGVRATGLHYSGLALQRIGSVTNSDYISRNCALVNIYCELEDTVELDETSGGFLLLWAGSFDHLLMWNVSFVYRGEEVGDPYGCVWILKHDSEVAATFSNCSFVGNSFYTVGTSSGNIWTDTVIDSNHFENSQGTNFGSQDANKTTGDPLWDTNGKPDIGSPLINTVTRLVPCDAPDQLQAIHTRPEGANLADIGAYEYQAP